MTEGREASEAVVLNIDLEAKKALDLEQQIDVYGLLLWAVAVGLLHSTVGGRRVRPTPYYGIDQLAPEPLVL